MTTIRLVAVLSYSALVLSIGLAAGRGLAPAAPRPSASPPPPHPVPIPIMDVRPRGQFLGLALAMEVLRSSHQLAAAQVGYAGVNPPQVLAWRLVMASPSHDSIFSYIVRTGTRPGQLYALAGLRLSAPAAYRVARKRLDGVSEMVPTQIGCVGSAAPLQRLLRQIDAGLWTREMVTGQLQPGH